MRSRCQRSARALGTWLACHWWRRDGNALAGRVRRCCREAAAPPGTPFLGGRSRVDLRPFLSVCSLRAAPHPDSPLIWRAAAVAAAWLRPRPWARVGVVTDAAVL